MSGYLVAGVHAPAALRAEVTPDLPPRQRRHRPESAVPLGVVVVIVGAEEKRGERRPVHAERGAGEDQGGGRGS